MRLGSVGAAPTIGLLRCPQESRFQNFYLFEGMGTYSRNQLKQAILNYFSDYVLFLALSRPLLTIYKILGAAFSFKVFMKSVYDSFAQDQYRA